MSISVGFKIVVWVALSVIFLPFKILGAIGGLIYFMVCGDQYEYSIKYHRCVDCGGFDAISVSVRDVLQP